MNKIFKVIWNRTTQSWVAVSELTSAKGKTKSKTAAKLTALSLVAGSALMAGNALAAVNVPSAIPSPNNTNNNFAVRTDGSSSVSVNDSYKNIVYIGNGAAPAGIGDEYVLIGNQMTGQSTGNVGDTLIGNRIRSGGGGQDSLATAVGYGAQVSGPSVSIGIGASTDIGDSNGAAAVAQGAVAIGSFARTSGSANGGVAVGTISFADQDNSTAIGTLSGVVTRIYDREVAGSGGGGSAPYVYEANGNNLTSIGAKSGARTTGGIAVGSNATTSRIDSNNAVAMGTNSAAIKAGSIALGNEALGGGYTTADQSTLTSQQTNYQALTNTQRTRLLSKVVAANTDPSAENKFQLASALASLDRLQLATDRATVDLTQIVAADNAATTNAMAMGNQARAVNTNAQAVGASAIARGANATATGYNSAAMGTDSIANGNGAVAGLTAADKATYDTYVTAGRTLTSAANTLTAENEHYNYTLGNLGAAATTALTNAGTNVNDMAAVAALTDSNLSGLAAAAQRVVNAQSALSTAQEAFNTAKTAADALAPVANAIAQGRSAVASGVSSIASGAFSRATGEKAVSIGNEAFSNNESSVALGDNANAFGKSNIALGTNASSGLAAANATTYNNYLAAQNEQAAALSNYQTLTSSLTAEQRSALGSWQNDLDTDTRIAALANLNATGRNAVLADLKAAAQRLQTANTNLTTTQTAFNNSGIANLAAVENAIAIGNGANASVKDGVALGSSSIASLEAREGFNPAGQKASLTAATKAVDDTRSNTYSGLTGKALTATLAGVSVGNADNTRQINHVAAGTADDDAVNVAQLRSVNLKIAGNTVASAAPTTDTTSKADVLLDSQTLNVISSDTSLLTTDATNNTITIKPVTGTLTTEKTTGDNPTSTGKIAVPANNATGGLMTAAAVADAINSSGFTLKSSATTGGEKVSGSDELINPGDTVEMVAGKNMKVTQESNGKITYATKDDVAFNTVALGNTTGDLYTTTDSSGNTIPVYKVGTDSDGNPIYNTAADGTGTTVAAANVTTTQGANPVNFTTKAATPATNNNNAPSNALDITSANGTPTQITGVASTLNVKAVDTSPAGTKLTGNNRPNLVDLVGTTESPVNPNAAATVGDLQNMGWVVSSNKTTGSLGNAYSDVVKNANEVRFVGTRLATVSGLTTGGVRTITVDVNAQSTVESAQTPVVYTTTDGTKLTKVGDNFYPADDLPENAVINNGKAYPAGTVIINGTAYPAGTTAEQVNAGTATPLPDTAGVASVANGDVIASMNDGNNSSKNTPMALSNVAAGAKTFAAPVDANGNDLKLANDGLWYPAAQVSDRGVPADGATAVRPTGTSVGEAKGGLIDFANSNPTNALTVADAQNMGWVVAAQKSVDGTTPEYADQVRNANEVRFVGANGTSVYGRTTAAGVREIVIDTVKATQPEDAVVYSYTDPNTGNTVRVYPQDVPVIGADGKPEKNDDGTVKTKPGYSTTPYNTQGVQADDITPEQIAAIVNDTPNITTSAKNADGSVTTPTVLNNIANNLPTVTDTAGSEAAADKKGNALTPRTDNGATNAAQQAPITAATAADLLDPKRDANGNITNPNYVGNRAATVSDVLNAGWNLQGNGRAVDFVKPYDTVNFVDGGNTRVVASVDEAHQVSKVQVNVTGLPITYTDANGNPVTKVGDTYYKLDANGNPDTNLEVKPADLKTNLVNPTVNNTTAAPNAQTTTATQLGNVAAGAVTYEAPKDATGNALTMANDGKWYPSTQVNANGTTVDGAKSTTPAANSSPTAGLVDFSKSTPTNAATVKDLQNMGWVVSTSDNGYTDQVRNANKVDFKGGDGIEVKGETTTDGTRQITVAIKKGTITNNDDGGTSGSNGGFMTDNDVSKAINNASWNLAANGTAGSEKIKPTNTVTFDAGKNMQVVRDGAKITYATKDDVNFNSVQLGDNGPTINNSNGAVNVNGAKITGVADGDIAPNSKEAVNGGQIYALVGDQTNVNQSNPTYTTITGYDNNGNPIYENKSAPSNQTVVTMKDDDGREIAVLKTYNVQGQKEIITNSVVEAIHNMNEQGIKFFHSNDGISRPKAEDENSFDSSASGKFATAIGSKSSAAGTNAVAIGFDSDVTGSDSIAVGTGNKVYASNSGAFGDPNIINGTTVNNVAVSGSYAIGNNNIINSSNTFVLGNNVNNAGNSTAMGSTVENSIYLGNQTTATGGDGSATGTLRNLDVKGNRGATTTAGSTGTVSQAVVGNLTYGGFAGATANGVVSVGAAGSERRIQNVAAGEISATSTDAINGSQLYSVAKGMGDLDNKVNRNNKDLRAGIAGANAAAGLPQVYLPGKSMVAASAGTFKGQNAVAVGYSRASDNGKVIFKLQGNANTRGDVGGSVGVGYQW